MKGGIFTANPRKAPTARMIPPTEGVELTYYGSEVVRAFTVERLMCSPPDTPNGGPMLINLVRKKTPTRVKSVENPRGLGTVVHPNSNLDASETGEILAPEPVSVDKLDHLQSVDQGHKKLPMAITIKEGVVVVNVNLNGKSDPRWNFRDVRPGSHPTVGERTGEIQLV